MHHETTNQNDKIHKILVYIVKKRQHYTNNVLWQNKISSVIAKNKVSWEESFLVLTNWKKFI